MRSRFEKSLYHIEKPGLANLANVSRPEKPAKCEMDSDFSLKYICFVFVLNNLIGQVNHSIYAYLHLCLHTYYLPKHVTRKSFK